jgi:hypothetical protein
MKIGHDLKISAFSLLAALCATFSVNAPAEASSEPATGDCAQQCLSDSIIISGRTVAPTRIEMEAMTIDGEIRKAEFPYRTADEIAGHGLTGQDSASEEHDRDLAIKNIGHDRHDINQNLEAVLLACMKKFGPGEACDKASAESWDEFYDCTFSNWDPVECSKSVADHMVPMYAAP